MDRKRKKILFLLISILLALFLTLISQYSHITRTVRWKIYDELMKLEYQVHHKAPSSDILLVTIGNKTLSSQDEPWPYSRKKFAKVINNLKDAQAKIIAFDFIFYGSTSTEEDTALDEAIRNAGNVVLGATIDEEGRLHFSKEFTEYSQSGVVSKFQDFDGVVRSALTYLISGRDKRKIILSWSLQILKCLKDLDVAELAKGRSEVVVSNELGEEWRIPVEDNTESFLIHFRSHTYDLQRISFHDVLKGTFNPACVKDKIVFIGLTSTMFGDIHNTSLGWMPGVALNANAFMALYQRDFIRQVPKTLQAFIVILWVLAATSAVILFKRRKAFLLIASEIFMFIVVSFLLLVLGWTWDYALFIYAIIFCPMAGKKILDLYLNI